MTLETLVTAGSILAGSMSILAVAFDVHSRRVGRSRTRTITITIEDSAGARARTVARSNRRVEDVKRDLERLVARTS